MIQFTCPCGKALQAQDAHAGRQVLCPTCRRVLDIPGGALVQPIEVQRAAAPVAENRPPPPAVSGKCPQCGKTFHIRDDLAGRKTMCPTCRVALVVPVALAPVAAPTHPPAQVTPIQPEAPGNSSLLYRVCMGSLKGILLPLLFIFLFVLDVALMSLLNQRPSAHRSRSSFTSLISVETLFVALIAILSVVLGAFAGNAIAKVEGGFIGAGLGYLLGGMTGGASVELMKGRRPKKS